VPATMNTTNGKYTIELFRPGGEGAGVEAILDSHDILSVARAIYRGRVEQYPERLIMLCDRARTAPTGVPMPLLTTWTEREGVLPRTRTGANVNPAPERRRSRTCSCSPASLPRESDRGFPRLRRANRYSALLPLEH
jgi:hypothetical protein